MKQFFLLTLFCLLTYYSNAQDDEKKVKHQFELNASLTNTLVSPDIISKSGTAFSFSPKYSMCLKKWFLDIDVDLTYASMLSTVIYDHDQRRSIDLRSGSNLLTPTFSFGRFIRPAQSFRMSVNAGIGYTMFLSGKPKDFVFYYSKDATHTDFYEGTIQGFYNPSLAISAGVGFYIPLQKNELCIKFQASTKRSMMTYIEIDKIENYEPVYLFDGSSGLSSWNIGVSVGYRFNNQKD
jgi:hypothetical protein